MDARSDFLDRLQSFASPRAIQILPRRILRVLRHVVWGLPLAAIAIRVGLHASGWSAFLSLLAATPVVVTVVAVLSLVSRRFDPLHAADVLDERHDADDMLMTAAHLALSSSRSPIADLLFERAAARLETLPADRPVAEPWRLPSLRALASAILVAALILLVPDAGGPLWSRIVAGDRDLAGEQGVEDADSVGENAASRPSDDIEGRIDVVVTTDRAVYMLGEEIKTKVRITPKEPLPEGIEASVIFIIDGEKPLQSKLPESLPTGPEETLEYERPMRDALHAIGAYEPGLVTIDTEIAIMDRRAPASGSSPGNRVVIQISENIEKKRTRYPQPTPQSQKPKPEQAKQSPPEDDKKKDQSKQQKKEAPAPGEGPLPPEEIDSTPFVVEPLFAGEQTKEREVKVYDRDIVDAESKRPDEMPIEDASRAYQRGDETEVIKVPLPPRDRRIVRRYIDALRSSSGGSR